MVYIYLGPVRPAPEDKHETQTIDPKPTASYAAAGIAAAGAVIEPAVPPAHPTRGTH